MDDHLTHSCPKRELKCGCGASTTVGDHTTHLALECPKVEVACDLGCGKVLLRGEFMSFWLLSCRCYLAMQLHNRV